MTPGRRLVTLLLLAALGTSCGDGDETANVTGSGVDPSRPTAPGATAATEAPAGPTIASSAPAAAPAPPAFLTPEDEGTYAMAVNGRTSLRLDRRRSWSAPETTGRAIDVAVVRFESDPGYDQYDVVAREPGSATVRLTGNGDRVEFTFVVVTD